MARFVEHLPGTQNVAGSNLPEAALFLLGKKKLFSGVVALLCLVSMTDCPCTTLCIYMYMEYCILSPFSLLTLPQS